MSDLDKLLIGIANTTPEDMIESVVLNGERSNFNLKPCPFCFCEYPDIVKSGDCYRTQCSVCMATGPLGLDLESVIRQWNGREPVLKERPA